MKVTVYLASGTKMVLKHVKKFDIKFNGEGVCTSYVMKSHGDVPVYIAPSQIVALVRHHRFLGIF